MENSAPLAVGAIIAIVLQVVVAPFITVLAATPNFLLVYCMLVAVFRGPSAGFILPFVLGLFFDLAGGGPIGAMAFTLVLATFIVSRSYGALANDTLFMALLMLVGGIVVAEVLYGILMIAGGNPATVVEGLMYRCLPCALYDSLLAVVLYLVLSRFFGNGNTSHREATLLH